MPPLPQDEPALTTDPAEARAVQRAIVGRLDRENRIGDVQTVAGVDVSAGRTGLARAAIVVLRYPELSVVEQIVCGQPIRFPYISGLLSFRELPVILDAWLRIAVVPDLVIVDGQGIAHPRRLGIAAHLGILIDRPTIGCAKSLLTGRYAEPGPEAGAMSPLLDKGERIGTVVRTKARTNPLIVSPGHGADVESATAWVLRLCRGYRLPEPTRQAHNLAARAARGEFPTH